MGFPEGVSQGVNRGVIKMMEYTLAVRETRAERGFLKITLQTPGYWGIFLSPQRRSSGSQ